MNWVKDDGGRAAAGYRGQTDDCTTRAIAIATQLPYQEVYELVNRYGALERRSSKRRGGCSSARRGVYIPTIRKIMADLGWMWTPTMRIGSGCQVHLRADELPKGRLVVSVSRHMTSVIDGVLHDTHDCSRHGTRCVYGYFSQRDREASDKNLDFKPIVPKPEDFKPEIPKPEDIKRIMIKPEQVKRIRIYHNEQ